VIDTPIKKNNISIFKAPCMKGKSSKAETKELKMHIRLFSGELEHFFYCAIEKWSDSLRKQI